MSDTTLTREESNTKVGMEMKFKDVRISVPWGHVVGRWYGNTQVRPILALHGWQDNAGTFDALIPLLPQHIGILCVDLPGHGHSSHYPKGVFYHVTDYVHIIMRIMKEYDWQKVSLMTHSMSSTVSFIYAALYPRNVDLLISFDRIAPAYRTAEKFISGYAGIIENRLIREERLNLFGKKEPPSYTFDELEHIVHVGSGKSVDPQAAKYILDRNITKSTMYPDKYYFSRDGRLKQILDYIPPPALAEELFKRIRNIPIFIIKAKELSIVFESSEPILANLMEGNEHLEYHVMDGTHHVHLNNPTEVAKLLNPFINRHRPATLDTWTMSEKNGKKDEEAQTEELLQKSKL